MQTTWDLLSAVKMEAERPDSERTDPIGMDFTESAMHLDDELPSYQSLARDTDMPESPFARTCPMEDFEVPPSDQGHAKDPCEAPTEKAWCTKWCCETAVSRNVWLQQYPWGQTRAKWRQTNGNNNRGGTWRTTLDVCLFWDHYN